MLFQEAWKLIHGSNPEGIWVQERNNYSPLL